MPSTPYAVPTFDVGGSARIKTTNRVELHQTVGMHDTAVITLRAEDMAAPELAPGNTVRLVYGWNPVQLDAFYGYIDHVGSSYEKGTPTVSTYNNVVCLGASYVLKDSIAGAWSNTQASSLVQSVATSYYLSSFVENDDYSWSRLSAPGCSAWQFLMSLADKLGYVLSCNKTMIRFVSVDQALDQYLGTMSTFYTRTSAPDVSFQSISNFQAVQGEAFPMLGRAKARRIAAGVDQRTGQVVTVANNDQPATQIGSRRVFPFFNDFQSDLVVTNQIEGMAALAGQTQKNRFNIFATANLAGDTSVVQGMPILLSGLNAKDNGVWWVEEVVHKFTYTTYSMDVSLGRDATKDSGLRPVSSSFARRDPAIPPQTILVGNRWRSAYQSNLVVQASSS